ncbi:PA14 domain-containing protein [Hymenobacter sp. BT770]|uniref:PA14 domain-containing protein n=1 Tax=Hymenobacter sp. BT770 TaxID=2886942 RepID=UPI001D107FBA|nr:PA14 domain-containing protein [Hymenobacter sp. BT770]MCC3151747.1 OmpA family protein [Hymenobacter sp. BT770]MDO3413631.1 PA14 domain-containing protein [Hymenobacter sp. BT770]
MAKNNIRWFGQTLLGCRLLVALLSVPSIAQTAPTGGDGLKGDYYEGTDFERFVLSRHDASLNFNWGQQPPAAGMPSENFSVRWTGWLVPPTSGRYVFYVTVDDGIRIWVNDKLILNEWRGQPVSNYTAAVALKANEPYRLRIDYCQYSMDTRAVVTWDRPDASPPPSSWHNLWGLMDSKPKPAPIPKRYLFSHNPKPPVAQPVQPNLPPKPTAVAKTQPQTPPAPAARPAAVKPRRPAVKPAPAPQLRVVAPVPAPAVRTVPDSSRPAQLARLSVGESVTLPDLYFNQGQARLLPAARTALDGLAAVLSSRPDLRLEVQGHTDNVGNAELNRQLSQQRAEAVCLYLTAHGVAAGQLRPVGYGGTQPVADNADPAQRPRNRRVVLRRL